MSAVAQVSGLTQSAGVEQIAPPRRAPRRSTSLAWVGLVPFGLYLVVFLALPTILAVASGVVVDGRLQLANVAALGDPVIVRTFWNSVW
ncbi:MAG: hypothetical protein LWW77_09760, partial [Propionibacteriales bacterium]|nr:hypothetical protein [Propionibacteriales bacterium]